MGMLALAGMVAGGCASGLSGKNLGSIAPVDLLVIPADATYPVQVQHVDPLDLASGNYDLTLSKGFQFVGDVTSVDNIPIDNASVRVAMRGAALDTVTTTGPTGEFNLTLGEGVYDVTITPDATNFPNLPPRVFQTITIGPSGPAQTPTIFTMLPGVRFHGSVHDASGTALQNWRISARDAAGVQASTFTNSTLVGTFEIFAPDTGDWVVTATPPPGATWPVISRALNVAVADTSASADLTYPPLTNVGITGAVTGAGSAASDFSNITVRAKAELSSGSPDITLSYDRQTTTDATGAFSLNVVTGNYTLYIEPAVDFPYSHNVVTALNITSDSVIDAALTTLKPKAHLTGTVSGSGGENVDAARIRYSAADGTVYQFSKRTESDGSYLLDVNVGSYVVDVIPAPDSGLVRATSNATVDHDMSAENFVLPGGARVSGRIFGSDGVTEISGATILALDPATATPVGSSESITAKNGDWVLSLPLAP